MHSTCHVCMYVMYTYIHVHIICMYVHTSLATVYITMHQVQLIIPSLRVAFTTKPPLGLIDQQFTTKVLARF